MGRIYTLTGNAAITTLEDIVEIRNGASHISIIQAFRFGQETDAGDTESEQLSITAFRATSGGSAGTDNTSVFQHSPSDAAARSSTVSFAGGRATMAGSGGLIDTFNVMAGGLEIATPETRMVVPPNASLVFSLTTAPADSITATFTLTWEEIGG